MLHNLLSTHYAKVVAWYDEHALERSRHYESRSANEVHAWLLDLLPTYALASVLDIGAGSGRDAAWLADQGFRVIAVEPSEEMQEEAHLRHQPTSITWVNDRLPSLRRIRKYGIRADFILLSAVWMHLIPSDQGAAMRALNRVLYPGGVVAISVRQGPTNHTRGMYEVDVLKLLQLAERHGLTPLRMLKVADTCGRDDVSWTYIALRKAR